jgi:signal transduction histidine kinase
MSSDAARARFLKAISHDMRQPLHALLLYLDALDRRVRDGEARAVLGKANQAAQALVSMFNDLHDLARIDAGKVAPDVGKVSVQELFDEIVTREPRANADVTSLCVKSDPVLLDQILRNLVSNAVKHGGGAARLSAAVGHGVVELVVRDAGEGIAAEDQSRIFEEFERLEGSSPDGLGLGLAIVQKLSDLLGHEIELRSAPGKGATFILRAPQG